MLEYKNIVNSLKNAVPGFDMKELVEEEPITVFSFFSIFLIKALKENNKPVLGSSIDLINEMSINDTSEIAALLEEIAISIFDSGMYNESFKKKLSNRSLSFFNKTLDLWKRGNDIKDESLRTM
ncbi:hypothetical protein GWK08_06640 [Leptobacterium flavescens]|uniref:Uncharacterized protein n=1 Tax=Leptobacterium flavescens TaxID=472055 RepID=A0A6P0UMN6_9FLAO|nr:hypothetical protein [Leptobacterium flavescens]NER13109.1 hypothetical protein [Leptobacterium flavescens]